VAEGVKVSGLRDLGVAMSRLSADMAGKVARQATAAGAGVVRRAARRGAPVDSGNLAAAIVMKRQRQSRLTEEYLVTVRKGKTRDAKAGKTGQAKQGKDAYYARFVEFGTVKMPARPFLRPALENNLQAATDAMAQRLKQRIEKANGK
jgi:HK97 gp10 family phage protein